MFDQCPVCFHTNFDGSPGDDLEAACGCDCHEERDYDESVEDEFPERFD